MTQHKEPCDECGKLVPIILKTRKHLGNIEENYIQCPHCKVEFIAYVTDAVARQEQKEIAKLHEEYHQRKNKLSFRMAALKRKVEEKHEGTN